MSLFQCVICDKFGYMTEDDTHDRKTRHIYSLMTIPNDNAPCLKTDQIQQQSLKKRGQSKKLASQAKAKRK